MKNDQGLCWWQRGVIYQIYPRSFKDTTGNGIGDLQGIIEKLDYLNDGSTGLTTSGTQASLGVDAIWLSPIYPSPLADFGYDVANYCDVHPLFGDLATFDGSLVVRRVFPISSGHGIISENSRRLCHVEHYGSQITQYDFAPLGYSQR